MRRISTVAVLALVLSMFTIAWPSTAQSADSTAQVRYGPFTIPAGTEADPGMINNRLLLGVKRPCSDCFITGFTPDLVYADGSTATMDQPRCCTTPSGPTSSVRTRPAAGHG